MSNLITTELMRGPSSTAYGALRFKATDLNSNMETAWTNFQPVQRLSHEVSLDCAFFDDMDISRIAASKKFVATVKELANSAVLSEGCFPDEVQTPSFPGVNLHQEAQELMYDGHTHEQKGGLRSFLTSDKPYRTIFGPSCSIETKTTMERRLAGCKYRIPSVMFEETHGAFRPVLWTYRRVKITSGSKDSREICRLRVTCGPTPPNLSVRVFLISPDDRVLA